MSEVEAAAPAVSEAVPAAAVETPTEKQSIEATMEQVYEKNYPDSRVERDRGNGQFKSDKAEGAEASDTASAKDQKPAAEMSEPASPAIARPASWSSDLDEFWASLPPERQEFLLKREGEAQKKITEQGEALKYVEPIKPLLEPLTRISQQHGIPPQEGLSRLIAAQDYLERDPAGAIQWLAQAYGVSLGQQQQQTGDPQYHALMQQVRTLQSQLAQTQHHVQTREHEAQQAQLASVEKQIEDFSKDKDYWPDIEDEILAEVQALRSRDPDKSPMEILKAAHDRALKLRDDIRGRLEESNRKKEEAKKAADQKRKADEAKRASSLNVKSSTGTSPKSKAASFEDEMAEVYDRLRATG